MKKIVEDCVAEEKASESNSVRIDVTFAKLVVFRRLPADHVDESSREP